MTQTPNLKSKKRRKNAIPEITLVAPLRPSAASAKAERLEYPLLEATIAKHWPFREARERRVAAAASDSLEMEQAERELQKQQLMECVWALQQFPEPEAQRLWSERFTQASIALYGAPDPDTARALIVHDLETLAELVGQPNVDQARLERVQAFYNQHLGVMVEAHTPVIHSEAELQDIAAEVKEYFWQRFGPALEAITNSDDPDTMVGPTEIAECFDRALDVLQASHPMWRTWQVALQDSGSLSVRCGEHRILVGQRREPLHLSALPGKFAHEALVHVLRQLHASSLGDPVLARGLAGYTDSEEGIASFVEYAVSGIPPQQAVERYTDMALAMGIFDGQLIPRHELFSVALDRKIVLDQAAGKPSEEAEVADGVWEHINRIYRGTRGEDTVGVFTKDVVYYHGFQEIATYLLAETKQRSIPEIFDYLLSCKFNPFDQSQADYVNQSLSKLHKKQSAQIGSLD